MSILCNSGRVALAAALKSSTLHLAWGRGETWWDTLRTDILTFSNNNQVNLAQSSFSNLVVKNSAETLTYIRDRDYSVSDKGLLTRLPSGSIGPAQSVHVFYTQQRPGEDPARTTLYDEIARKKVTETRYVIPDASGEIIMTSGRFSYSPTPTRHLLFRTIFAFNEASTETIREIGLYLGTLPKSSIPPGQYYLLPADIDQFGILLTLQYTSPIIRNGATQQSFESVLTL